MPSTTPDDLPPDGAAGFCLNTFAFIEFLEGSSHWERWSHENNIGRENSVFFSAFTYGIAQIRNRLQKKEMQSDRTKELFRLLRQSALNARILPVSAETMDLAAITFKQAREEEGWKGDNITPFVEYSTAYYANLTLVVTDDEHDPSSGLQHILSYPINQMKIIR